MSKRTGFISAISGALSSTLGLLGSTCIMGCGGTCVAGPLAVMGSGIALFLARYNKFFLIGGGLLFLFGITRLLSNDKKNCGCPSSDDASESCKTDGR